VGVSSRGTIKKAEEREGENLGFGSASNGKHHLKRREEVRLIFSARGSDK